MTLPNLNEVRVGVIGLGYVGLPLAVALASKFEVVGFDLKVRRVEELGAGLDRTNEVGGAELAQATRLSFTTRVDDLPDCNVFIVTVPTPIDVSRRPDMAALEKASTIVGSVLKPGRLVVYESTVYPGATEEVCVPILEKNSGLNLNQDFAVGYSPERINPGDPSRRLQDIKKVTSGSTPAAAALVDKIYASIISAGTHAASSIRVAEAAKIIENIQRDINIALINELAQLFKKLDIETREVLAAAATKWNFQNYKPGLVGGHCIGVDPYYLTHKAQTVGFHPEIILAGRRVNDGMAAFVAHDVVKMMAKRKLPIGSARLLLMGFTFKEDCPDVRNTKIADLYSELRPFCSEIVIVDPHADPQEATEEYGVNVRSEMPDDEFDGILLCVKHTKFVEMGIGPIRRRLKSASSFVYDLKELFDVTDSDGRI